MASWIEPARVLTWQGGGTSLGALNRHRAFPIRPCQVSEDRLIELLEQVNEQTQQKTRVTIQRRRAFDDDDF